MGYGEQDQDRTATTTAALRAYHRTTHQATAFIPHTGSQLSEAMTQPVASSFMRYFPVLASETLSSWFSSFFGHSDSLFCSSHTHHLNAEVFQSLVLGPLLCSMGDSSSRRSDPVPWLQVAPTC